MMSNEKPMTSSGPQSQTDEPDAQQLEKWGISRVTAPVYIVGDYRYTQFKDALAEAKRRDATASGS